MEDCIRSRKKKKKKKKTPIKKFTCCRAFDVLAKVRHQGGEGADDEMKVLKKESVVWMLRSLVLGSRTAEW